MISRVRETEKQKIFNELFAPDEEGKSRWVLRDEINNSGLKPPLDNGAGRPWGFWVKGFLFETKRLNGKEDAKILEMRLVGIDHDHLDGVKRNANVRKDIKAHYKGSPCVVCGCTSSLRLDHKNDTYNNPRVFDSLTQLFSDFQNLCNHCNLQKRQVAIKTKKTMKRTGATTIPSVAVFGIDFTEGDDTYDPSDVNCMVGTYWYDPVAFMEYVKWANSFETQCAIDTLLSLRQPIR